MVQTSNVSSSLKDELYGKNRKDRQLRELLHNTAVASFFNKIQRRKKEVVLWLQMMIELPATRMFQSVKKKNDSTKSLHSGGRQRDQKLYEFDSADTETQIYQRNVFSKTLDQSNVVLLPNANFKMVHRGDMRHNQWFKETSN